MIIFPLKFFILIFAQIGSISDRSFLQVQCHSIDFLLRVCLSMDQWSNPCVIIERTVMIITGTRFVKKKSKQVVKKVIIIIGTSIHDPIYRRLIHEENNDDDEKFHFFAAFIINLISPIILITKKSRQQSNLQTHRTCKELVQELFQRHKHLFTAPLILVILAIPRLTLSIPHVIS